MRGARGLIAALALAACAAAHAQSAGEWASGAQLWRDTCRYCHEGKLAPELRGAGLDAQAVARAVRHGPGAMPSFLPSEISDQDLERLAAWIRVQPKPTPAQTDEPERTPRHETRQRIR
jgi:mono/diheme cytochrome c family protein